MLGNQDESEFEHYQIADLLIKRFPAAAHVYIKQPDAVDYTLFCSFGTVAAAEEMVDVLRDKGDVDAYMVNVPLLN